MKKNSEKFNAFAKLTDALLSVSHSKIQKAEEKYKQQSAKNPHKRGPKPKRKGK